MWYNRARRIEEGESYSMRTERANAKINLYLDVVSRRENGYHNIQSLMQTVSLCDLVTLDYRPSIHTSIRMQTSGNDAMPTDCRNLAWRAAEKLLAHTERSGEVLIVLEKHIPMAAGLAGGSADAAAVLRGLNVLLGSPLSTEELCALGAELGADIPFCILGGCARVSGIGEELEPLPSMSACPMVVACMGEGVSTPWAYGRLDEMNGNFAVEKESDPRLTQLLEDLKNNVTPPTLEAFYNIFEEVVPAEKPAVTALKESMLSNGALRAMMSGSGPSVFGIFASAEDAKEACEAARKLGADAFVCHPRPAYN